jgi:hypothetical protein
MTPTRPFGRLNRRSVVPARAAPQPPGLAPLEPVPELDIDLGTSRRLIIDWLCYVGYVVLIVVGLAGLRSSSEDASSEPAAAIVAMAQELCGL